MPAGGLTGLTVALVLALLWLTGLPTPLAALRQGGAGGWLPLRLPRTPRDLVFPAAAAPLAAALAAYTPLTSSAIPSTATPEAPTRVLEFNLTRAEVVPMPRMVDEAKPRGVAVGAPLWTAAEAAAALRQGLGGWFEEYEGTFVAENVTGAVLLHLTDADLRDWLRVPKEAHRRLVLEAAASWRPLPPAPGGGGGAVGGGEGAGAGSSHLQHPPGDAWAACSARPRDCHLLLQGLRSFPRATGLYLALLAGDVAPWLLPQGRFAAAGFAALYVVQPHLALSLRLTFVGRGQGMVQIILASMGLTHALVGVHGLWQPPTLQRLLQRTLREQMGLLVLAAYWMAYDYLPAAVHGAVFWATVGDEALHAALGAALLTFATALGLFILLLGLQRGVVVDEFVKKLCLLFITRCDKQRWPPALAIPEWVQNDARVEVPAAFVCPITKSIMALPTLVTSSGLSYDHEPIRQWVRDRLVEPQTRDTVTEAELAPNRALYTQIQEWLQSVEADRRSHSRLNYLMAQAARGEGRRRAPSWLDWARSAPGDGGGGDDDDADDPDYAPSEASASSEDDSCDEQDARLRTLHGRTPWLHAGEAQALVDGRQWAATAIGGWLGRRRPHAAS